MCITQPRQGLGPRVTALLLPLVTAHASQNLLSPSWCTLGDGRAPAGVAALAVPDWRCWARCARERAWSCSETVPQVHTKGAERVLVQSRYDMLHRASQTEDIMVSKALLQGHEMGWSGA